jgi:hypothetical protein
VTDLVPLDERRLSLIERQAKVAAKSGLVPTDNPDAAAYIMLRAAGFGLDPLTAFEHFHLIDTKKGPKLIVSSAFLGGMARHAGARIEWLHSDQEYATARLRRPDQPGWTTLTYTFGDARKADLVWKDNWKNHPAPMLRAACQRQLVRMAMPDVLLGLPMAAEVDMDAEFDEEGLDEGGEGVPGPGDVRGSANPGPGTWRPPPVDERVRARLIEQTENLHPAVAAAVRDVARNLGMPALRGPHFTRAHGALLHRLIDEAEAEQAAIDAGHPLESPGDPVTTEGGDPGERPNRPPGPTPDHVHDDAPEGSSSETDDDSRPV